MLKIIKNNYCMKMNLECLGMILQFVININNIEIRGDSVIDLSRHFV